MATARCDHVFRRPIRRTTAAAVLLVILVTAGCNSGGTSPAADGTGAPTTGAPTAAHSVTPSPATAVGRCVPAQLMTCIIAPADGRPYPSNEGYIPSGPITASQYVGYYYRSFTVAQQDYETKLLQELHVHGIAHRTWQVSYVDDADVVLLDFASADDARGNLGYDVSSTTDNERSQQLTPVSFPGLPQVTAYRRPAGSNPEPVTEAYASSGQVEMVFFCYTSPSGDTATVTSWLREELALLATASGTPGPG